MLILVTTTDAVTTNTATTNTLLRVIWLLRVIGFFVQSAAPHIRPRLTDLIRDIRTSCDEFMAKARDVPAEERRLLLQRLTAAFTRSLKHGESKVTLAMQTYDMVCLLGPCLSVFVCRVCVGRRHTRSTRIIHILSIPHTSC